MQFHGKKYSIYYLISRVFFGGFFKIFWPAVKWKNSAIQYE